MMKSVRSRRTAVIFIGALGLFVGGIAGYRLSWAWAAWATQDPEWDGGMAVMVVYGIIAAVTFFAAVLAAALSAYLGHRLLRRPG